MNCAVLTIKFCSAVTSTADEKGVLPEQQKKDRDFVLELLTTIMPNNAEILRKMKHDQ